MLFRIIRGVLDVNINKCKDMLISLNMQFWHMFFFIFVC